MQARLIENKKTNKHFLNGINSKDKKYKEWKILKLQDSQNACL